MCWLAQTVLVTRLRSMVPDAGALPPQGISLVLAAIGNCPDAATICLAAANTERGGRAASNPASTATDRRIGRVAGGATPPPFWPPYPGGSGTRPHAFHFAAWS